MQRRAWLFAPVIIGHVALLLLALPTALPASQPELVAITMTMLPAPVVPMVAWTPSEIVIPSEASAPDIEIAPALAAGTPCAVGDSIQIALRDSPSVVRALELVPVDARSIADAVMLWDGRWTDAARVGGEAALGPIRAIVEASIGAAPEACRRAAVAGPRLVYVAVGRRTMILAFGSGQWAWNQLLISSSRV